MGVRGGLELSDVEEMEVLRDALDLELLRVEFAHAGLMKMGQGPSLQLKCTLTFS